VIMGVFNLDRIGIAVLYYATRHPLHIKIPRRLSPDFLRCCVIEAPPLTPLLTNPLTVLLCWRRSLSPLVAAGSPASQLGDVANRTDRSCLCRCPDPRVFPLSTLRYRFDFAPFMTLAAFVGYRSLSINPPPDFQGLGAGGYC